MEQRWNLDDIYTSFESEAFRTDFKRCDDAISAVRLSAGKCSEAGDTVEKIERCVDALNDFNTCLSRLWAYTSLVLSVESKNKTAIGYLEKLEEKMIELTEPRVQIQKWLSSIANLDECIDKSDLLKEHAYFLKEQAKEARYLISEKEEIVLAKLKKTGSSSWRNLCNMLISNLMVTIETEGQTKELPLPVVRSMSHERDRETRKKAYYAEMKAYDKIEVPMAACLNAIKGEVQTVSDLRGYGSPLEMTLMNSRMKKESLDAMLKAIRKHLPRFRDYYRKKNALLGNTGAMPFYDVFAPLGADMKFSYSEAKDFIVRHFGAFSGKLSSFAENAFSKRWIDSEPREGKRGGAFCYNIHSIKQSRILSNFKNSLSDVSTLAHELGHGYHGECLKNETPLNSDYSMPVAETASIFCETIVNNAAKKTATKEELTAILESELAGAGQVIVDIYSRYIFETNLFQRRVSGSLQAEELNGMMADAQKEAYGDALDQEILHPKMWINKPHYYYVDANFYNFPYAFGLLFAKGLYADYLKRGSEFVSGYDDLLRATGSNSVEDVASIVGIDVTTEEFWLSSLELIEKDIDQFMKL